MSKISEKRRRFEIRKKQKRRKKIKRLKEKYLATKTKEEKEKILEKLKRSAFHYPLDQFLGTKK